MDDQQVRCAALIAAAAAHAGQAPASWDLTAYAATLTGWLDGTVTARLSATLTITADSITSAYLHSDNGGTMATSMTVNQTAVVKVLPEDTHGNATPDTLTWTADDNGTILTGAVSADKRTWTGTPTGTEGTVTVTASDPAAPTVAAYTAVITVGPGPTSQLAGTVQITGTP